MEFDNIETIKQAIGIAAGVSILPRPTVAKEVGHPHARPRCRSRSEAWSGRSAIIHRKGQRLPPAVARFIDVLRKAGDAEAPGGPPGRSGRAERP